MHLGAVVLSHLDICRTDRGEGSGLAGATAELLVDAGGLGSGIQSGGIIGESAERIGPEAMAAPDHVESSEFPCQRDRLIAEEELPARVRSGSPFQKMEQGIQPPGIVFGKIEIPDGFICMYDAARLCHRAYAFWSRREIPAKDTLSAIEEDVIETADPFVCLPSLSPTIEQSAHPFLSYPLLNGRSGDRHICQNSISNPRKPEKRQ
jgi:hypothetical protein